MTRRLCACGNRLPVENIPHAMRPDRKRYAEFCVSCLREKGYRLIRPSEGVEYWEQIDTVVDTLPVEEIFERAQIDTERNAKAAMFDARGVSR